MKLPDWAYWCLAAFFVAFISISVTLAVHSILYDYAADDFRNAVFKHYESESLKQ